MLNEKSIKLLDKLYNLCSNDSVVLAAIDAEVKDSEKNREKSILEKEDLETKIDYLSDEKKALVEQGNGLITILSNINSDYFRDLLDCLKIEFNPEQIVSQVKENLPSKIETITDEIEDSIQNLNAVNQTLNEAIAKISELTIRREEAINNQDGLKHYKELALDSNINLTREEITSLLSKFDFDVEEQKDLAKLLMFPEDGLLEYDKLKNGDVSIQPIIEETNLSEENNEDIVIEPILEADDFTDEIDVQEPTYTENDDIHVEDVETEEIPIKEESVQDESKEITNEYLMKKLEELGFDYLDFTSNDFNQILENYNEEVIEKNVKFFENKKINKEIFFDNIELLYDSEIENKVNKLIDIGKLPEDIYLNPGVLTKYNFNELNEAIKLLNASGLNPKDVPLMAY